MKNEQSVSVSRRQSLLVEIVGNAFFDSILKGDYVAIEVGKNGENRLYSCIPVEYYSKARYIN